MHGGLIRLKLPAVQLLASAAHAVSGMAQVGVAGMRIQLDMITEAREVSMAVMVESGMP